MLLTVRPISGVTVGHGNKLYGTHLHDCQDHWTRAVLHDQKDREKNVVSSWSLDWLT